MSNSDGNAPAYPVPNSANVNGQEGLTRRELFAIKMAPAVYGWVVADCERNGWPHDWREGVAVDSVRMADALLAELAKEPTNG